MMSSRPAITKRAISAKGDERASKIGGFGIGLTVLVDILVDASITGVSTNPARTFGPALTGHVESHKATARDSPYNGGLPLLYV